MSKGALSVVYFTLTFVAGAAVGSWALWIYLMGFPQDSAPETVMSPPAAIAPAAPIAQPASPPAESAAPAAKEPEAVVLKPEPDDAPPTPTPKGHWNTEDVRPRSHEECLALTKELNDAYKDCRFGSHKKVWVPEE